MPEQFWRLTYREFSLKHEAFMRHEDRMKALIFEHSLMGGGRDEQKELALQRQINALRRYPIKPWLVSS